MKFRHLVSFTYICYFTVDFEVVLIKAEFIVCNDYVPTSSPGRFSLALKVGRPTFKAREKRARHEVDSMSEDSIRDMTLQFQFRLFRLKLSFRKLYDFDLSEVVDLCDFIR